MKTEILATYHTKSGIVAATVRKHGPDSYSWTGKLGAGSGGLEHVRQSVVSALNHSRGVRLASGTSIESIAS